jgi:hypothetical protein
MKRYLVMLLLFLTVGLFVLQTTQTYAKEDGGQNKNIRLSKALQGGVNRTLVNVGNVAMWIYADGTSANEPDGDAGWYFPRGRGTATSAIFQDGFIWGGQVNDGGSPRIRVGGQTYSIGTVPGRIISAGVAEDFGDPEVDRVWRVRRDYATADLGLDASEVNLILPGEVTETQIAAVRQQYKQDWIDWPVEKGAPFYDAGEDGVYSPQFTTDAQGREVPVLFPDADEPGYANADQVVWLVANDLFPGAVQTLYGSPAIGFEMQLTLWAYRRADALGNIVFKQFRMIYKGTATTPATATIDSLYFCQWSDIDLGDAGDDLAGCDTTESFGFVYNASDQDRAYAAFGLPPPSSGYDFFAGPIVASAPSDTAIFGLKKRGGFRNLPMSSFAFFAAGQVDSDPTRGGDYNGTLQWWNLLRGFRPRPENPPDPWREFNDPNGRRVYFRVPGDPVTGEGWIDENPGDRRILLVTGPFTMAVGDTQETVVAAMSGLGSDRLSSITVVKAVDRFAQKAFNAIFEVSRAPATPVASATEFDGEILINWGDNLDAVAATEQTVLTSFEGAFHFEGYNVYQLPTAGSAVSQGVRLATFDLTSDPSVITQQTLDPQSGLILNLPVQFGKNTGINRTIVIDTDRIRGTPLINGQIYFFGVTAYSFNRNPAEGSTTATLESPPAVVTVVPQTTKPGVRYSPSAAIGDTIASVGNPDPNKQVIHTGPSDGSVTVISVDPSKLTGHNYKVAFTDVEGGSVWHLINTTRGDTLLKNQTNQTNDLDIGDLNVEGFKAVVVGAPNDFKDFLEVANSAGPHDPTYAAFGFNNSGFPTALPDHPDRPTPNPEGARWGIHTGRTDGDFLYSFFVTRVTRGGVRFPEIVPFDFEIRFTAQGGLAWMAFSTGTVVPVPFELWNIGAGTPDDPSDDYRMIPWCFDVDGNDAFSLVAVDHPISGGDNDPETDWFYWYSPQDRSPGQAGYENEFVALGAAYDGDDHVEAMARMVLVNFNGGSVSDTTFPANVNQVMPPTGTVYRILSTKPNTSDDSFTFTTAGFQPTSNPQTAEQDIRALVNVFPNPYYGFNSRELNRFNRFVRFSHLPPRAIIRIFNLAGALVRTIEKDDPSQFINWDLQNTDGLPVASGIYIANMEFPELGFSKNLKLAIILEQQFLRNF